MTDTQNELIQELEETDRRTRALIEDLSDAQLDVPYERGINPPVWELGHAAFFYEYFLLRALDDQRPRMPGYDEIWDSFEIMHKHRWSPGVVPDKATTVDYYSRVLDETRSRLEGRIPDPHEQYLYRYVIAHQQMHIESLIWSRQTLGYQMPPFSDPAPIALATAAGSPSDLAVPGGDYFVGMPADSDQFATADFSFDNERPGFRSQVAPFKISKSLVSNGEFLEFVQDRGYRNEALWSFGGKCWLADRDGGRRSPAHWREREAGGWQLRRFDQWIDLPPGAPALHLSFWEAEAFCSWAGRRLPTEPEWEAAARGPESRRFPWGDSPDPARADLDGILLASSAVDAFPESASPAGCLQMLGTAWEWTSSQFLPYDGFKIDMYPYMSVLQFGDHKVTKGGSCATCSGLIRNSYRQAYAPGRSDVFTGFRTCPR
ncbi:ergothioneine biosynthesis protein EgtB [soil metagenome]